MLRTTLGQLMVNDALPEDLRDYTRSLDSKGMKALFRKLADKGPDVYREVSQKLLHIGQQVSHNSGSSFSLNDLKPAQAKKPVVDELRRQIAQITSDGKLSPDEKHARIIETVSKHVGVLDDQIMQEKLKEGNRIADFALSGARGGKSSLGQMVGSGLLVTDNKKRPVPYPILNGFSEGMDPAELWAASYGVRAGYIDIKSATPKAGYFGKQLANAAHRLVVSGEKPMPGTGLAVDTDDSDTEGSVLAADYGPFKEGTLITPKILKALRGQHKKVLVHSPISAIAPGGGVPRSAVGLMEDGNLPRIGDNIGIVAAQSISEPLAQSMISAKHGAGVVGGGGGRTSAAANAGFPQVNALANIPETYVGKATVADTDGAVTNIDVAPQGGHYVTVGNIQHYVPADLEVSVKPGQHLEAGDTLSSGIPSPEDVVRHKGIGEGRRYLMETMRSMLGNMGVKSHRRNFERMSRALVNHIRLTGTEHGDGYLPGDVVEYDDYASKYSPREGAKEHSLNTARGKYLEAPVLHYSIGTRITPRVLDTLKEHSVPGVLAHDEPPAFVPEMQRAVDSLGNDKDWMVRIGGFNLQKNMLDAVHRGSTSTEHSTSWMPTLARGIEFGAGPNKTY